MALAGMRGLVELVVSLTMRVHLAQVARQVAVAVVAKAFM